MPTLTIARSGWRHPAHSMTALMAAPAVADAVWVEVRRTGDGKLVLWDAPVLGGREVAANRWVVLADTDLGDGHRPALLDEALVTLRGTPVVIYVPNDPGSRAYEPDHRVVLEVCERAGPDDLVIGSNPGSLTRMRARFADRTTGLYLHDATWEAEGVVVVDHRVGLGRVSDLIDGGRTVILDRVDGPSEARELARLGAWGIITTRPEMIREALEEGC